MMKLPEQGESRSSANNYFMKRVNNSHQELPRNDTDLKMAEDTIFKTTNTNKFGQTNKQLVNKLKRSLVM